MRHPSKIHGPSNRKLVEPRSYRAKTTFAHHEIHRAHECLARQLAQQEGVKFEAWLDRALVESIQRHGPPEPEADGGTRCALHYSCVAGEHESAIRELFPEPEKPKRTAKKAS